MKTLSILCLFIIIFSGCSPKESIKDYEDMSIFDYLIQPEEKLNISIAALILSKEIFPSIDFVRYENLIDSIAARVKYYVKDNADPEYRIAAINTVLFREYGYGYDKDDYSGRQYYNHFISSVFDRRKGVCTSLPLVYMIISEKLNYPVYAVEAPDHTFCRYKLKEDAGKVKYINIETTSGGGEVPDLFYLDDMQIPKQAYKNGVYMRSLTKREYIGSLLHKNAVYYMSKGDYIKAVKYLEKSISLNYKNSHNHKVLSHCYKKICNSLESAEERKPYYFKANKHDAIADNLGIAPPCADDYWEKNLINNSAGREKMNISDDVTNRNASSIKNRMKKLEVKYRDYYQ